MAKSGIGNFACLYSVNRELYEALCTAERNARIHYENSGKYIRKALECFVSSVISEKKLESFFYDVPDLNTKLSMLLSERDMRDAGYLTWNQSFIQKPLLPYRKNYCVQFDLYGSTKEHPLRDTAKTPYYLLRKMGNACSHVEPDERDPKIHYENILLCLKALHWVTTTYYSRQLPRGIREFDETKMPIGDFVVDECVVPEDRERSKCALEFLAHTQNSEGEPEFYALLRMYNRKDCDKTFLLRNQECFFEASKVSVSFVPEGMAPLSEITPRDSVASDFYILCYRFSRKAQRLTNSLLRSMSLKQKLVLCARLVSSLENLHNSETPIYHRLLNHECVYVSQLRGNWVPYIVKFDYAKIYVENSAKGTVFLHAAEANSKLKKLGQDKYLPREWQGRSSDAADVDWAKVDVYSLGVLLCDILKGTVTNPNLASLNELADADVPDEILNILDAMLAESPQSRCSMRAVRDVFDREAR